MSQSRIASCGHWVPASLIGGVLGCLLSLVSALDAQAQGFGPDPYKPYNSRFDAFVYPVAPGPLDYGFNQGFSPASRSGVRNANQFESYLNSLRGDSGPSAGRSGNPYARSDRSFDKDTERIYQYRPNRKADEKFERFEADQDEVSNLYFRYLREKDPKKRAEVFRAYNKAKRQADRDLNGKQTARASGSRRQSRQSAPRPDAPAAARPLAGPAPSVDSEDSRAARGRPDASRRPPPVGAAPSLDEVAGGGAATGDSSSPSRVLERALRSDPSARPGARSTPPSLGPPPPP